MLSLQCLQQQKEKEEEVLGDNKTFLLQKNKRNIQNFKLYLLQKLLINRICKIRK